MQWINCLKDKGIGKTALLIGGGLSVKDFDFKKLDKSIDTFVINDGIPSGHTPNFLVYNDGGMIPVLKKMDLPYTITVIGNSSAHYPRTNICYSNSMLKCIDLDNTGLKALIITKNIMNYDKIYLIGYDFHTRVIDGVETSHHQGDPIGRGEKYIAQSVFDSHVNRLKIMKEQFEVVKDFDNVFNCYEQSKLDLFSFGLPF